MTKRSLHSAEPILQYMEVHKVLCELDWINAAPDYWIFDGNMTNHNIQYPSKNWYVGFGVLQEPCQNQIIIRAECS